MTITLYHTYESPESRAVRLVAAALGVNINLKTVDFQSGENMTPEFLKMNIQHDVPVMDDNGFYLAESRAIIFYLVEKYGKNEKLFPHDIKMRSFVWERMFFDFGTFYQSFVDYYYPAIFEGGSLNQFYFTRINTAFEFLDKFLMGHEYIAGPHMTIADLTTVATLSTFDYFGYNFAKWKNVTRWYNLMKTVAPKYKEVNEDGARMFAEFAAPYLKH